MKQIYYEKEGQQLGPLDIDQIQPLQINADTLVWQEGMSSWKKAKDMPELEAYLNKLPPPLPPPRDIKIDNTYDLTYKRERNIIYIGIGLLLTPYFLLNNISFFLSTFFLEQIINWNIIYDNISYVLYALTTLFFIPVRILSTLFVRLVSMKQNRNYKAWGLFAFILPSISMISIGSTRRIKIIGQPSFLEIEDNYETKYKAAKEKKYRQIFVGIIFINLILFIGFTFYQIFRY